MLRFRLFGFPITVEPWHWAVLAFLSGGLLQLNNREMLLYVVMFVAAGFVSILIHELGHAFMSRRLGCRRVEIIMHGMGGVAISHDVRFTRGQHILVSIAGPALQAFCGGLVYLLLWKDVVPAAPAAMLLSLFVLVSIFWAVINLLPVYPLDGGQILVYALGPQRQVLSLRISMLTAIAAGVAMFLWSARDGRPELLFPLLLGFMAWQNYQTLQRMRQPW